MSIKIQFDAGGLEETLRLLRIVTNSHGPDIETSSADENFREILKLAEFVERGHEGVDFFSFESRLVPTEGATKEETWIILEPAESLRKLAEASCLAAHGALDVDPTVVK